MTIQEFIDAIGIDNLDCIWVKDEQGNLKAAPGNTPFRKVEMDGSKYHDVTFTI